MTLRMPAGFADAPTRQALDFAMTKLKFDSTLRRADMMAPGRVDGIYKHTKEMLMWHAVKEEGESDWIARALHPGDMPPTTTTARDWLETTGTTSETFVDAAIGNGTSINDDVFIGIYGFQFLASENRDESGINIPYRPPVTSLRFVVGGTRVAEWDLNVAWKTVARGIASTSSTAKIAGQIDFPVCIAESPIFVLQNKTLLLQYYEESGTTATDFIPLLYGIVVEKRGAGDGLNP